MFLSEVSKFLDPPFFLTLRITLTLRIPYLYGKYDNVHSLWRDAWLMHRASRNPDTKRGKGSCYQSQGKRKLS